MASSSNRRSGSSARSTGRKRVVIGADETVRVRYAKGQPKVDTERKRKTPTARPSTAGQRLSNSKRVERERRVATLRFRRVLIWVAAVAAAVALAYGVNALIHSAAFEVQGVVVHGTSHLTPSAVASDAAVPKGATLISLPAAAIERNVQRDAWVASAVVRRQFPHTVVIDVVERRPAAVVDVSPSAAWIVSADGVWLASAPSKETSPALVHIKDVPRLRPAVGASVASTELANALAVAAGLSRPLKKTVVAISAPSLENTALLLNNKVEIFIGPATDIARKDQIARAILARQKNKVLYVNVRTVDRPTWRGLDSTP